MLNQERNTNSNINVLETLLLLFYNIDVKLNEVFNSATISFGKSSSLLKSIFNPLQKYSSNLSKLINQPGQRTNINPYSEFVKENITVITTQLQFHDVFEQRLKHIRLIHDEIIQNLIAQKKSPAQKPGDDLAYIKMVAQINTAQISNVNDEYIDQCKKLDESLEMLNKYLVERERLSLEALIPDTNDDLRFLAGQNVELSNRIIASTSGFATDVSYRNTVAKNFADITKSFTAIAFEIKIKDKLPSSHERLKKLEDLYTTAGEREVFNRLVYAGSRIQKKSPFLKNDSEVEFF
jgi:hypothetical protein